VKKALLFVSALGLLLTGCPSMWSVRTRVYAQTHTKVSVLSLDEHGAPISDDLESIPGVNITCEGCSEPITMSGDGQFFVPLGVSYSAPAPIVLHISAAGYQSVDVDVPVAMPDSQLGLGTFVVVLKPLATQTEKSPKAEKKEPTK
jgi:hypothetical protein